jgi:hypothetical protein
MSPFDGTDDGTKQEYTVDDLSEFAFQRDIDRMSLSDAVLFATIINIWDLEIRLPGEPALEDETNGSKIIIRFTQYLDKKNVRPTRKRRLFDALLRLLNDVRLNSPIEIQGNAAVEKIRDSFIKQAKLDRKDKWKELTYADIQHIINTATEIFGPGTSYDGIHVSVKMLQNTLTQFPLVVLPFRYLQIIVQMIFVMAAGPRRMELYAVAAASLWIEFGFSATNPSVIIDRKIHFESTLTKEPFKPASEPKAYPGSVASTSNVESCLVLWILIFLERIGGITSALDCYNNKEVMKLDRFETTKYLQMRVKATLQEIHSMAPVGIQKLLHNLPRSELPDEDEELESLHVALWTKMRETDNPSDPSYLLPLFRQIDRNGAFTRERLSENSCNSSVSDMLREFGYNNNNMSSSIRLGFQNCRMFNCNNKFNEVFHPAHNREKRSLDLECHSQYIQDLYYDNKDFIMANIPRNWLQAEMSPEVIEAMLRRMKSRPMFTDPEVFCQGFRLRNDPLPTPCDFLQQIVTADDAMLERMEKGEGFKGSKAICIDEQMAAQILSSRRSQRSRTKHSMQLSSQLFGVRPHTTNESSAEENLMLRDFRPITPLPWHGVQLINNDEDDIELEMQQSVDVNDGDAPDSLQPASGNPWRRVTRKDVAALRYCLYMCNLADGRW